MHSIDHSTKDGHLQPKWHVRQDDEYLWTLNQWKWQIRAQSTAGQSRNAKTDPKETTTEALWEACLMMAHRAFFDDHGDSLSIRHFMIDDIHVNNLVMHSYGQQSEQ